MPRTTSKTNSKSYRSPPPPLQTQQPPMRTPTPLQIQPPSMFDTMKQGFSFGVGSSIAHSIFGPKNKDENVNKKEALQNCRKKANLGALLKIRIKLRLQKQILY